MGNGSDFLRWSQPGRLNLRPTDEPVFNRETLANSRIPVNSDLNPAHWKWFQSSVLHALLRCHEGIATVTTPVDTSSARGVGLFLTLRLARPAEYLKSGIQSLKLPRAAILLWVPSKLLRSHTLRCVRECSLLRSHVRFISPWGGPSENL